MPCKKEKHFNCKNCRRIAKTTYKNNVEFCSGLVKKPNPECDKWRFCISRGTNRHATDIMYEELVSMIHILSASLMVYTCENANNTKNATHKKKENLRRKA